MVKIMASELLLQVSQAFSATELELLYQLLTTAPCKEKTETVQQNIEVFIPELGVNAVATREVLKPDQFYLRKDRTAQRMVMPVELAANGADNGVIATVINEVILDKIFDNGPLHGFINNQLQLRVANASLGSRDEVSSCYINYYRDGNDSAPIHCHHDTVQVVISLGHARTLKIGNNQVVTNHGDLVMFGAQKHGVPKEPNSGPRFSIAFFIKLRY